MLLCPVYELSSKSWEWTRFLKERGLSGKDPEMELCRTYMFKEATWRKSTLVGKLRVCFKNSSRKTWRQQFVEANIGELKNWSSAKLLNSAKKSNKIRAEDTSGAFGTGKSLIGLVKRGSVECQHRRGWRILDKNIDDSPRHLALNRWRHIRWEPLKKIFFF